MQKLNQQNAAHFGVIRGGGHDLGDAEAFEAYDDLSVDLLNDIDKNLTEAANDARGLAIANAVVTIALLIAAIFLALLVSRMLLNPIRRVREGALEVANTRLPEMVAKIRAGGDPGEITPIDVHTHEEMGQLARAVDDMHRQAVHLASGEAHLRSQVGEMFSTLSRRNTSLINQQLGLIERLEKDEEDPNRLESLFRLDHLASRMRRTADSLMVLADAPVQTGENDALALGDVFQAAMAGVQEYQRVQIESSPPEKVNGAAAADVVHMMTELVDNALAFSPPTAPVKISTKQAGDSTIVEISDGGLGIAQDVLNSLNEDLRSGGEVTPETARRMGLLVVSRIATRHGITVSLARNPRGGTTATVLLPPALLRGQQTQVLPKQRPGLSALTPAKSVLPAAVTERLTNESEPKKLPTRPEPAAPAAPAAVAAVAAFAKPAGPAAPAAPAAAAATAGPAKSDVAENQVDSINAAINAVTSALPQRAPGATRSGGAMPGAPVGSMGGSLFQRLQASGNGARPKEPELPQREPATPTVAFNAIDLTTLRNGVASPEPDEVETPKAEAPEVEAAEVEIPDVAEPAAKVEEPPAPVEDDAPQEVLAEESALDLAQTPAGSWVAASEVTAYDLLDSRSPMPEPTEDETPIFRDDALQLAHCRRRRGHLDDLGDRGRLGGRRAGRRGARRSRSASPGCRCGVRASGWCPVVSRRPPPASTATRRRSGPGSPRTPPASRGAGPRPWTRPFPYRAPRKAPHDREPDRDRRAVARLGREQVRRRGAVRGARDPRLGRRTADGQELQPPGRARRAGRGGLLGAGQPGRRCRPPLRGRRGAPDRDRDAARLPAADECRRRVAPRRTHRGLRRHRSGGLRDGPPRRPRRPDGPGHRPRPAQRPLTDDQDQSWHCRPSRGHRTTTRLSRASSGPTR